MMMLTTEAFSDPNSPAYINPEYSVPIVIGIGARSHRDRQWVLPADPNAYYFLSVCEKAYLMDIDKEGRMNFNSVMDSLVEMNKLGYIGTPVGIEAQIMDNNTISDIFKDNTEITEIIDHGTWQYALTGANGIGNYNSPRNPDSWKMLKASYEAIGHSKARIFIFFNNTQNEQRTAMESAFSKDYKIEYVKITDEYLIQDEELKAYLASNNLPFFDIATGILRTEIKGDIIAVLTKK